MKTCLLCNNKFPTKKVIDGKLRNMQNRKYCLECSPFQGGGGVIQWRRRAKQKAILYKGGGCQLCGYKRSVSALHFHHLNPDEKGFSISGRTLSWKRIQAELDKCILLCANCHSEVHEGLIDFDLSLCKGPTPTWGAKRLPQSNPFGPQVITRCVDCRSKISPTATRCKTCAGKARPTKIKWPSTLELLKRIEASSQWAVSQELGVSDAAVEKRIKNHPPNSPTQREMLF